MQRARQTAPSSTSFPTGDDERPGRRPKIDLPSQFEDVARMIPEPRRLLSVLQRGAHERTLQRLFKPETGTTFGRWRTQLRLQHGVIALGQGQNVTTTAATSGYREASAFIAAFRSAFGTTPGRYVEHSPAGPRTNR